MELGGNTTFERLDFPVQHSMVGRDCLNIISIFQWDIDGTYMGNIDVLLVCGLEHDVYMSIQF